MQFFLYNLSI